MHDPYVLTRKTAWDNPHTSPPMIHWMAAFEAIKEVLDAVDMGSSMVHGGM